MTYPHRYTIPCGHAWRCRCNALASTTGERGDNCRAAMREHIAELSAHTASIHKAKAEAIAWERAAVVRWLRLAAAECGAYSGASFEIAAGKIERGDHHKEDDNG